MPNIASKSMKRRILEFIAEYSDTNIIAPSYREIGAAVGLKSPTSVSRYVEQLKDEGILVAVNQKVRAITLLRKIEFHGVDNQPQRVCLKVADGGTVYIDCSLEKKQSDAVTVSFSGIVDASQMKGRVGQVVSCRIEDS